MRKIYHSKRRSSNFIRLMLLLVCLWCGIGAWAAELKLRVFDIQSHPITHAKMLLNGEQMQRTDNEGYVTFEISDLVYAKKEDKDSYYTYYLRYECDDAEASYYNEHHYTRTSEEIRVYPQDEGRTIDVCFNDQCVYLNFDFTKHLSELQRNILKGKVIKYTASTGGVQQETRNLTYNGESVKRVMFWMDRAKECCNVTCETNSEPTGKLTSTTNIPGNEVMPATIDVNLFDGLVSLTLNSLKGIDGKPVKEGTVGMCDLANGLPAMVAYINPNDNSSLSLRCLLKGYQGFTYNYSPDEQSFDIDLTGNGKATDLKLLDHQGKPMQGAQVLTHTYPMKDSILIAETDANGMAHYNTVNSTGDIWPWELIIKPNQSGYICPPEIPEGEDEGDNKVSVIINYAKYHFVDLRVKNAASEAWQNKFGYTAPLFSVKSIVGEYSYNTPTTSFYDDNDLVYRAFIDNEKIDKDAEKLQLEYKLGSNVLPYIVDLSPISTKDVSFTISPLDWKNVEVKYSVPEGITVSPESQYYIDDISLSYDKYEKPYTVIMPAGDHTMRMAFSGDNIEYELGTAQEFSINNTEDSQTVTYTLRPENYTGYALTVVAPNGQPAEDYLYYADDLYIRLNEEGKGAIYLANEGEHTFRITKNGAEMKPYAWKETLTKGQRSKTIDLSQLYYKVNISVKTVASQPDYYSPKVDLIWAETEEALKKAEESNKIDYEGLGDSYKLYVSSWEHEDGTQLYTQTVYLPKGIVKGTATMGGETECHMPTTALNSDIDYTFDYSTFGIVKFTIDGNPEQTYSKQLKVYSINEQKMLNEAQEMLLEPGEYKACVIGYKQNGDYFYVLSPSKTFTITGGEQTIDMPSAKDEDYVKVNLNIKNADESLTDIKAAAVAVTYDGVFNLTKGNNYGAYYFNSRFPWTMLKGSYDYELIYTYGDEYAFAFNTYGHVDIVDSTSTFDLDLAGKHKFANYQMKDGKGNDVDWAAMGLKPFLLEISDNDGNYICKTATGNGIILPYGDYQVTVYATDDSGKNNQKFNPTSLHIDAQSGSTATLILPEATGISNVNSERELVVRHSSNGLTIESSSSAPVLVTIHTTSGTCVKKATAHNGDTIETSALTKGTYIVRLQQGKKSIAQKFMK